MAIKILMTLEGDDVVVQKLDNVAKKGDETSKTLGNIGKDSGQGVQKLVQDFQKAGLQFQETGKQSISLGNSLKLLGSSFRLLGAEGSSTLGILGRLAGRGGIGGLIAIATGAAAVGIGKLEEDLARLQGQLADTFGGDKKGQEAFAALNAQAKQFGTSAESLATPLQALQRALNEVDRSAQGFVALRAEDLPAALRAPTIQATTDALKSLNNVLRAGRLTQDEAEKSATALFEAFRQGAPAAAAALAKLPEGSIKLLQEALGAAGLSTQKFIAAVSQGAVPIDRLVTALAKFGPEAQKAFDTKAIVTMGDAWGKLEATANKAFEAMTGRTFSGAIVSILNLISSGVEKLIDGFERLKKATPTQPQGLLVGQPAGAFVGAVPLPTPRPEEATQKLGASFIFAKNSVQEMGIAGVAAGKAITDQLQKATDAANAVSAAMAKLAQASKAVEDLRSSRAFTDPFADFGVEQQNAEDRARRAVTEARIDLDRAQQEAFALSTGPAAEAGKKAAKAWVEAVSAGITVNFNIEDAITVKELPIKVKPQFEDPQLQQMQEALDAVGQRAGTSMGGKIKVAVDQASPPTFNSTLSALDALGQTIQQKAQEIWNNVNQIVSQPINFQIGGQVSGGGGGGLPPVLAGGGQMRGPGSTTSDSIWARLSNREWVINTKAVDFYGSGLFSALNSMRLPRTFAAPRFAEGGQAAATGSSLTLVLGGRQFEARASEGTVSALRRFAVNSQLASIGRKPGFVR